MSSKVETPFPIFTDIDGSPLEDGYIYVGTAGLDPATNAITVYSNTGLSTVVAQPIRTKSGFPVVSGSPIRIYANTNNYSLKVSNKNNSQVLQDLNAGASSLVSLPLSGGTMTGQLNIEGLSPQIKFTDTSSSQSDFWINVNTNRFHIYADRDNSGGSEAPDPLVLDSSTNKAYTFGNEIVTLGNQMSGMIKNSNGATSSLTDAAIWLNGTQGALMLDNDASKRISWNDGGGNLTIRGGSYYSSGDKYVNTGDGASAIILSSDSNNGNVEIKAAATGTAGNNVSWGDAFVVRSDSLDYGGSKFKIDSSGNLGLGTSTPAGKVEINKSSSGAGLIVQGGSGNTDPTIVWQDSAGSTQGVIDYLGNLGVGTSSPTAKLQVAGGTIRIDHNQALEFGGANDKILGNATSHYLAFSTDGSERMRLDASGNFLVGKTSSNAAVVGTELRSSGEVTMTRSSGNPLAVRRNTDDGKLVSFIQDVSEEGTISVSGTTVSYNGGHLARWSRMLDGTKPDTIKKGTVMTNLDEMIEWAYDETPEELWAAGDGLPEGVSVGDVKIEGTDETEEVLWSETDGLPEGVSIGDVKVEYKPAGVEDNEQLNHTAISSVEGDKDVAGVFIAWDDDDDYNDYHLAMVGDVIIRIAEGVEVKRGDLLISAGDGTAKPLDPEAPLTVGLQAAIVAKVTSTVVSCTYDDGSFCVPCVLK